MNFEEQKTRYLNDPEFCNLVNLFYSILSEGKLTFYEIKDAVTFAATKFYMENAYPFNELKRE